MRLLHYFLDFEHDSTLGTSAALLYDSPLADPLAHVEVACYYKDRFSRKAGRRAALAKLLSPTDGPFAGPERRKTRQDLWMAYWQRMPQDLYLP